MIIDTTQTKIERDISRKIIDIDIFAPWRKPRNWVASQATCRHCGKVHDILNFATAESFNGVCSCGKYVCTIVYGSRGER